MRKNQTKIKKICRTKNFYDSDFIVIIKKKKKTSAIISAGLLLIS